MRNSSSVTQRRYRNEAGQVDVGIQVDRRKQFHYGALQLRGFSAQEESKARALWKLKEGDPMNTGLLPEFFVAASNGMSS